MFSKITTSALLILLICLGLSRNSVAQTTSAERIEEASVAIQNNQFERALDFLQDENSPQAWLLRGQAFYQLNEFSNSARELKKILLQTANPTLVAEAQYTLALISIQKRDFATSVVLLDAIQQLSGISGSISSDSNNLKRSLLRFMDVSDLLELLSEGISDDLMEETVVTSLQSLNRADAQLLGSVIIDMDADSSLFDHSKIRRTIQTRPSTVQRSVVPPGFAYRIGIILPFDPENEGLSNVSGSLYKGIMLAAQQHNADRENTPVYIEYINAREVNPGTVMGKASFKNMDLLIGPLVSETASRYVPFTTQFEIPLIAPLANSDTLNQFHPYFFQANPTLAASGRAMARFAYNQKRLDTASVISGRNAEGIYAARAFRAEFERLGGHIVDFYTKDFNSDGFEFTEFTEAFTTNKQLIDSLNYTPVDAVFAPFTGGSAPSLIDLLLTDLEANRSKVTVLGSEDYAYANLIPERINRFEIYYPTGLQPEETAEDVISFKEDYLNFSQQEANDFSFKGYDLMNFILASLKNHPNPTYMNHVLRTAKPYTGLGNTFHFNNSQVNTAVTVKKLEAVDENE